MFAIVTDSTSSTPAAELEVQGVTVVPLTIVFGSDVYREDLDMSVEQFYDRMRSELDAGHGLPKTSCPDASAFERAFADALDDGAEGVLCITISAGLSGTNDFANIAANQLEGNIEVIDSKGVAMETTYLLEKAIRMRDEGVPLSEAAEHMRKMAEATRTVFVLDTMENLIKGGRVGKATGLAASALKLKPLLTIEKTQGLVDAVGKARGSKGAIKKAVELAQRYLQVHEPSEFRIEQGAAPERMEELEEAMAVAGLEVNTEASGWISAVVGTYSGLNSVAIVGCPKQLL